MPRRREIQKRIPLPDPKYKDVLLAQFINVMMKDGKKSLAEKIMYTTLEDIESKTGEEPLRVFKKAVENCRPHVEVKSRRVGGSNYQVPIEVRAERRDALSFRWIIKYARLRSENTMTERLTGEILDAANFRGAAIRKREETHKMAEANKAFAHYRW